MPNSLGNALKYLRRHVYLHAHNWRVLIICNSVEQYQRAYDEILRILDAGSLKIESANPQQGWIQLEKGAMVRFGRIERSDDKFKFAGMQVAQIMWMYSPEPTDEEYIRSLLRSNVVPEDQLVDEKIDW